MATSGNSGSFPSRPSTGQAFTSHSSGYSDLSALAPSDPFAPLSESEAGGNTVNSSENGAPGSTSEQTENSPDRTVTLDEGATHDYTNHV